ncbi:hypothetical protein B296_00051372 [Ensete ventricosum]|uniref:Uncharacterized protein n=1 Tax=Ensete ventricosum TaxID=4639 RepID=A0A426XX89_ENSVE|nr:hypothetical protein B296_00051372 [Ensete ventricosum]
MRPQWGIHGWSRASRAATLDKPKAERPQSIETLSDGGGITIDGSSMVPSPQVGSKDTSCLEAASLYGHEARASKGRGEIAAIALEPPTEGPTGEIVWFVKDVHPHVGAEVDTVAVGGDTPHR